MVDNKLVKESEAKFPITGSIGKGYGVFETLRTYENKKCPFAQLHVKRLFNSAKKIDLKIKYSKSEILKMLEKVIKKSPYEIQRIKIMAIEEGLILTSVKTKIDPSIYKGVSIKSIEMTRSMPEIKSLSYLPSFLAHEKAVKQGFFDALLIDEKGEVFEGAYSNIFWFEGSTLCTRKDKVLPGIIRKLIIKDSPFKVKFKTIKLKDLIKKDEIFLTGSVNLIVPVVKIDNKKINKGKVGEKTLRVMESFKEIGGLYKGKK